MQPAGQAEIIRSNQKDDFYSIFIKRSIGDIAQSLFGPRSWLHWRKELDLAADMLYFGLTTFAGFQTLGEEYVNIIQLDSTGRKIPSRYSRGAMILLQVVTPYLLNRLLTYVRTQAENNTTLGISQKMREAIVSAVAVLQNLVSLLHRCHLTLFYVNGVFYHIAKRILGIHYIRIKKSQAAAETTQSNYRVLGWLSVIQLGLAFLQHIYQHLKTRSLRHKTSELPNPSFHQTSANRQSTETANGSSVADSSRKCSLCLETRKQSTATPCGHLFCWDCIMEWCSNKAECPLCRDKFEPSRLIFLQNYDPS